MSSRIGSTDFWFLLVGAVALAAGAALLGLVGSYDILFIPLAASPYTALWMVCLSFTVIPDLAVAPLRSEPPRGQLSAAPFLLREFRRRFGLPVITGTALPIAVLLLLLPPEWARLRRHDLVQTHAELMDDAVFCLVCSAAACFTALATGFVILLGLGIECRIVDKGRIRPLIRLAFVGFGALLATFMSAELMALYSTTFSAPHAWGVIPRILFWMVSLGSGCLVFALCLLGTGEGYDRLEASPDRQPPAE